MLNSQTLAVVRKSLQERRSVIERCWDFRPDMTEDEALSRFGFMSHTPSSLHIMHFGEYQLLGKLIEDMR
jgi:hypothetical protein